MKRLVSILALVCVLMVMIAGSGAFLLSKIFIAKSKVDAVAGIARGISLTLSEQVDLLNSMLDKMVQDPEIITAAAQKNPELLATATKKIENHFPGILTVKYLLPEHASLTAPEKIGMGFADFNMAKKSFTNNQLSAIQGDAETDRHLAIARRIMQNGIPVGVILVGLNYDFVSKILSSTQLEKGYIELRQDKLILATTGEKDTSEDLDDPIEVPNTDWQLYFENNVTTSIGEYTLMICIVVIPALAVGLSFVTGYRKLSDLLAQDMAWLTKAFKDIVTDKPLGDYPVNLGETRSLISTMAQFKRVISDKLFEV